MFRYRYSDYGYINWIDVCQGDGNLLVAGGGDLSIKVIDRRESRIVKTFSKCHSGEKYSQLSIFTLKLRLDQLCEMESKWGYACQRL